ncbi:MAG: hypothetical protein G01um101431_862 [Parcubacteria group bacterium Gr01-1014_31]|nr:MAG: hypothetical protein G01um101431_862 [Parcubacteria group bacterium Gr01-1014_31]
MKVAEYQQPYVLTDEIAAVGIPHMRPVRARIPRVQLKPGGVRAVVPFFCNIGELELLQELPDGEPCPNLSEVGVVLRGTSRLEHQRPGWVDLITRIFVNGKVDVRIEEVVPC